MAIPSNGHTNSDIRRYLASRLPYRELIRFRAVGSLRRLEQYLDPSSGLRHLTLTTDAMIKAAEFWAFLRQRGIPTASPDALDADAILAGQAALAGQRGDTIAIATTNLAHLNRFPGIDARTWDQVRQES